MVKLMATCEGIIPLKERFNDFSAPPKLHLMRELLPENTDSLQKNMVKIYCSKGMGTKLESQMWLNVLS